MTIATPAGRLRCVGALSGAADLPKWRASSSEAAESEFESKTRSGRHCGEH
jgi:hypothetical protein